LDIKTPISAVKQLDEVHSYLKNLLGICAPHCEASDDTLVLCTQIDNWVAGCLEASRANHMAAAIDELAKGVKDSPSDFDHGYGLGLRDAANLVRGRRVPDAGGYCMEHGAYLGIKCQQVHESPYPPGGCTYHPAGDHLRIPCRESESRLSLFRKLLTHELYWHARQPEPPK